uniref:PH domain-containing protein n=1 Tax=Macrostomum lignano TaxID=282301 RepID=A0A1I8FF92_9PLAT
MLAVRLPVQQRPPHCSWWVFADQKTAGCKGISPAVDLEYSKETHFLCCHRGTVLLLVLLFCLVRGLFQMPAYCLASIRSSRQCLRVQCRAVRPAIVTCLWLAAVRSLAVDSGLHFYYVLRASRLRLVLSGEPSQAQMAGGRALADLSPPAPLGAELVSQAVAQSESLRRLGRLLRQMSPIKQIRFGCRCAHRRAVLVGCRRRLGSAWQQARLAALGALNSAGDFVLLTAKLAVSAACTIVCTVLLMIFSITNCIGATFAFLVAHCFLSVFEFVIDAIFICFSLRFGTNDGSPGRGRQFMTDDLKNLVFDTCDAMTSNLPPGSIGNSSSRRQAAAATMRLTSSGVQQENGAKTAAVDDEAAAHLRLSELEDLDQMEDVPDIALQPQGRPDSSLRCAGCRRRRPVNEADDDLRSLRTPASTPIRSTGGRLTREAETMPSPDCLTCWLTTPIQSGNPGLTINQPSADRGGLPDRQSRHRFSQHLRSVRVAAATADDVDVHPATVLNSSALLNRAANCRGGGGCAGDGQAELEVLELVASQPELKRFVKARRAVWRWTAWTRRFATYINAAGITDKVQGQQLLLYAAGEELQAVVEENAIVSLERTTTASRKTSRRTGTERITLRFKFQMCSKRRGAAGHRDGERQTRRTAAARSSQKRQSAAKNAGTDAARILRSLRQIGDPTCTAAPGQKLQ